MGKTAFALNLAQHVGVELNEPVAIFSLEMSKKQLALRMLCSEAMVDSNSVRNYTQGGLAQINLSSRKTRRGPDLH